MLREIEQAVTMLGNTDLRSVGMDSLSATIKEYQSKVDAYNSTPGKYYGSLIRTCTEPQSRLDEPAVQQGSPRPTMVHLTMLPSLPSSAETMAIRSAWALSTRPGAFQDLGVHMNDLEGLTTSDLLLVRL